MWEILWWSFVGWVIGVIMARASFQARLIKAEGYELAFGELTKMYGKLVKRVNAKGGERFLEEGTLHGFPELTNEDLKRMLILCHPDKHAGKEMAQRMTQRLLEIRDNRATS